MPTHERDDFETDDAAEDAVDHASAPKKSGNWFAVAVVAVITVVALIIGQQWVKGDGNVPERAGAGGSSSVDVDGLVKAPKVGDKAPSFESTDLEGAKVVLEAKRGKPVWVVFMASWCTECRIEAPDVQAASEKHKGIDIVAVYLGESERVVRDYAKRIGLTIEQIPDPTSDIARAYGVRAIPAHYFIDGDGIVQEVLVGALSESRIEDAISKVSG